MLMPFPFSTACLFIVRGQIMSVVLMNMLNDA